MFIAWGDRVSKVSKVDRVFKGNKADRSYKAGRPKRGGVACGLLSGVDEDAAHLHECVSVFVLELDAYTCG